LFRKVTQRSTELHQVLYVFAELCVTISKLLIIYEMIKIKKAT